MHFKHAAIAAAAALALLVTAACSGSATPPVVSDTAPPAETSTSMTLSSAAPDTSSSEIATTSTSAATTSSEQPHGPTDPLTGLAVSNNPVIAVKIENTDAGMPQYGVADADIIYTEQVEGGLVRLIAIYHTVLPTEVGAVRSVRSTDVQLLPSYGAPILVYSGGATAQLTRLRGSDLIATTEGAPGFWRSKVKRAPYNLHANLQTIAKRYPGKAKAQPMGFEFAVNDPRLGSATKVTSIDVTMVNGKTSFRYADARYQAYFWDKPYLDAVGDKHLFVDNVLIQRVDDSQLDGTLDPAGNPSHLTKTLGSGSFTLYRDGRAITGTWSRSKVSDPTRYLDGSGKPVLLKPGKTWVLLAPSNAQIVRK
ncbi:MAG: hypothetical protein BGO26_03100 [Actinobacteria bacterium 69-20]|jgi:hypothetical protein|nr:DUF3048 domain-containing protein [Actinomycetota bacterium]OJV30973.1 MAG: hypothetical protein BGO26_03100 [Actinobacteria bacterium 69-20]